MSNERTLIIFEFNLHYKSWLKITKTPYSFPRPLESTTRKREREREDNHKLDVPVVGTCVEDFGIKQGELCRRDNDCETGLMCQQIPGRDARSCQPPTTSNKLYSELKDFILEKPEIPFCKCQHKWFYLLQMRNAPCRANATSAADCAVSYKDDIGKHPER